MAELKDCWMFERYSDQPCWGKMSISEDYPGIYVMWCEGHGHPEDLQEYKPPPKNLIDKEEKSNNKTPP